MGQIAIPFVLSDADLTALNQLVTKGKDSARKLNRARALQFSHQGRKPQEVSELLGMSVPTIYNLRKRYREGGLQAAITEKARPGQPRKVTSEVEAEITAIACSEVPDGSVRWTANLINDRLIKLDIHIHEESVRLALKKVSSSPGLKSNGALGR